MLQSHCLCHGTNRPLRGFAVLAYLASGPNPISYAQAGQCRAADSCPAKAIYAFRHLPWLPQTKVFDLPELP
jgi:hypothetical protein